MSKTQEIIAVICFVASFGLGYACRNSQVAVTVDKTTQVKDDHTVVTTITSKTPSGDVKVVRTIDSTVKTNTVDKTKEQTPVLIKPWNVSALAGLDMSSRLPTAVYGVSVTKQILGPLNVGAFGLTNGIIGVSLGVNF